MKKPNPEQFRKFIKYGLDPIYAMETLFQVPDINTRELIPFKLTHNQTNLLTGIVNYRFNVVKKGRFLGSDTLLAAWVAVRLTFDLEADSEVILYCSSNLNVAHDFIAKVKFFLDQIPEWVWEIWSDKGQIYKRDTKNEIVLHNNNRIKSMSQSRDAMRGFSYNHLIMNDAAYYQNASEIFGACLAALGTGGKATVISTPNGFDSFFQPLYSKAEKMTNNFNNINMHWAYDPRFNEDMFWEKDGYCVHEHEYTKESIYHKLTFDWKPYSKWQTNMIDVVMGYQVYGRQEIDGEFVETPRR